MTRGPEQSPVARLSPTRTWLRALERTANISGPGAAILPVLLEAQARIYPDRPALLGHEISLSYDALVRRTRLYARWARNLGVERGDKVGVLMTGGPEYVALWLGLLRAGAVATLFAPGLSSSALVHGLTVSGCRRLIAERRLLHAAGAPSLEVEVFATGPGPSIGVDLDGPISRLADGPLAPNEEGGAEIGDLALQIFTSGTTGLPKAARLTHRRILSWSGWFCGLMDAQPEDRLYNCLPLHHSVGGVAAVGALLVAGGSIFIRDGFSASAFWKEVCEQDCTLFQYIGELCRYLLAGPSDPNERSHRLRLACGNGLRAEIWTPFKDRFAIPRILEFYASTEGNFSLYNVEERVGALGRTPAFLAHRSPIALVAFDPTTDSPQRTSQGRCAPVARGEVGEALARIGADSVFEGYADRYATEEKILRDVFTEGDAWFRSGDLLRQDQDGFYIFVDRVGDTFRWKGENVSTAQVAAVLTATGFVADAVVYGVSVPGAEGRAGMASLAPAADFDLGAFRAALIDRLPPHARPRFLRVIPAVETTGTFKPKKAALQAEGFDPLLIRDPLFVDLVAEGRYAPLDEGVHQSILAGRIRF